MANENTGKQDPDEIRREIERTRSNMESNIQSLQARLDPERLKYEAKSKIREQTVGRVEGFADNATETVKGTGADVFDTIKRNPLPAALAAIGLGWLFMERRNTAERRRPWRYGQMRSYYGERYGYANADREGYENDYDYPERGGRYRAEPMGGMRERTADMRDTAGQMAGQARRNVSQAASAVGDTASQMASNVSDTASQVASNVSDTASQVAGQAREQVGEWADAAQRGAYQAKTRFQEMMDENPLLIGAAALALGAAIGLSLPHTPQEDQLMGQARDDVMQKAQYQARDTMDKVQQVAEKAGTAAKEAAKSEAQNQNLTG